MRLYDLGINFEANFKLENFYMYPETNDPIVLNKKVRSQ